MRSFWWFEENFIAGMARPGFNQVHWTELAFEEAVVFSWLGQYSSGSASLDTFKTHVESYAPRIIKFFYSDIEAGKQALRVFYSKTGLQDALDNLSKRSGFFKNYEILHDKVRFETNQDRLQQEIDYLKRSGIEQIVTLTEKHHSKEVLADHFDLHHISIEDLNPPTIDQVRELVRIITTAKSKQQKLAVHCLAGIGRTSTMLLAANLLMGKKLDDLLSRLSRQNPSFVFTGPQSEFVKSVAMNL